MLTAFSLNLKVMADDVTGGAGENSQGNNQGGGAASQPGGDSGSNPGADNPGGGAASTVESKDAQSVSPAQDGDKGGSIGDGPKPRTSLPNSNDTESLMAGMIKDAADRQ